MKNIQYFILCFSIILSFALGQIENSTISEEVNRGAFTKIISSTTPEPTRNSSTNSHENATHHCHDCPDTRGINQYYTSAKRLAEMSFKLFVLFLIIV